LTVTNENQDDAFRAKALSVQYPIVFAADGVGLYSLGVEVAWCEKSMYNRVRMMTSQL